MGDVIPQKRQSQVDRLRRRIEHYRRHQSSCTPRYNAGLNGLLEDRHQDTMLLRQRFLEAKAKKANKKSDNHKSSSGAGTGNCVTAAKDSSAVTSTGGNIGTQSKYKRVTDVPPTPSPLDLLTTTDECGSVDQQSKQTSGTVNATSKTSTNNNNNNPTTNNNNNNQSMDQGLTQFSVEIVQQFTSPGQTQGQHIQTNVTVTAVSGATNIKTSDSPVPNSMHTNAATSIANVSANSTNNKDKNIDGNGIVNTCTTGSDVKPPILSTVECKQEPKFDLDCGGSGAGTGSGVGGTSNLDNVNNEPNFSDSFSGFIDDSNDDDINLNFNSDTFNYLMDALPPDLMTAYLEKLEDDALEELKSLGAEFHHHNLSQNKNHNGQGPTYHLHHNHHPAQHHSMNELNKMCDNDDVVSSMSHRNQLASNTNAGLTGSSAMFSNINTSGGVGANGSNSTNSISMNQLGTNVNSMGRIPPYGGSLGLDFNLKEPSPAAQTLKQMAEQHQSMQQQQQQQQQQQHLGMGIGSSSPFSTDFSLGSGGNGSNGTTPYGSSSNIDFLTSTVGSGTAIGNFMHSKGTSNNMTFPFGQMTMSNSMLKQDPMFRPRQTSNINSHQQHNHVTSHLDMRKQQMPAASPATLQRLGGADQKPGVGHSPGQSPLPGQPATAGASPGPCSTPGSIGSPLSFGATKPLTHFSDTQSQQTSINGSSSPGAAGMSQMSGQFMPQQTSTQQPAPNFMNLPSMAARHGFQVSQTQQLQVNQNSQQMQVTQCQQMQLNDLKGQQQQQQQQHHHPHQQQQVMYNFSQQQQASVSGSNDQYQLNASQSQSVTFGGGSDIPMSGGRSIVGNPMLMSQTSSQNHIQQQSHPRLMHHQQMVRHQMLEKQKVSHQLQQQQQSLQQQRLSQFVNRPPPPEYNAQVLPMGHQMSVGQQQQQQQQQPQRHQHQPNVLGVINQMPVNQTQMFSTNVRSISSQGSSNVNPQGARIGPKTTTRASSSSMLNNMPTSNQMTMNGSVRPSAAYQSSMLRDQRPPNVNIGPDGLNIGNRGMTNQEWRQMMVQNQAKFQSLGGGGGGSNASTVHQGSQANMQGHLPRPMMSSSAVNMGGLSQTGYSGQNQMGIPMQHHGQTGMMRGPVGSGGPMSMMQQRQTVNQMQNRVVQQQQQQQQQAAASNPMMSVQMSSSVTMSTGGVPSMPQTSNNQMNVTGLVQQQNSGFGQLPNSNNTGAASGNNASTVISNDFNFDFFDSLSGPSMDGSGSGGFGSNVDADLLNSFDSVMQNGNSGLNLLEGL